jgi:predicted lactoylglutathione lyase
MINSIFVNLPIANLKKSMDFFGQLGFSFNEQFTDEQSTCMILSDTIYVMLVEEAKFKAFIPKPLAPKGTTEAILAFSLDSAAAVRTMTEKALSLGATKINDPEDHGFMFSWGFEDLDGHLWDLFWMNPEHVQ